mgnify:CR=1 FL=1
MIPVFLANGFEEIEALATVDILRRSGVDVVTVGVGSKMPEGAHGIAVCADISEAELLLEAIDGVVLPGGMPGTTNLEASAVVRDAIAYAYERDMLVAAICAAPSILGHDGYLRDKKATCYPGFEPELFGATVTQAGVVVDGNIITASGAGVAVDFALELVRYLVSDEVADTIRGGIQCP